MFVFELEFESFFFDVDPSPGGCFFISSNSFTCFEKSGLVGFVDLGSYFENFFWSIF